MTRLILFICLGCHFCLAQTPLRLRMTEVADGFVSPVGLCSPHDGSNRLFVVEQGGKVKIITGGEVLARPFIDISSRLVGLNIAYSEKGLLGMAFHPDFKNNGLFYLHYSAKSDDRITDHKGIIAVYRVSPNDPNLAIPETEKILMEIPQPESNHNGGQLAFGKDGYLYIGLGDGGGAGDKHGDRGNGQDLNTWLGKLLRIDVNAPKGYKIPPDNPFVNMANCKPEIWAYGLRNPWRFSFDRATQKLFCADVGQNQYEEINIIRKGGNYGWRIMEGKHCYEPAQDCDQTALQLPVAEYDHREGISVIGGYVYRGLEFPSLHGHYLFGDWSGKLWYLKFNEDSREWDRGPVYTKGDSNEIPGKINSFGEDEKGNVYVVTQKLFGPKSPTGAVFKIGF